MSGKSAAPNFGVKLVRPGFGPAAELPALPQAPWRHGGCRSPLGSANVIGGNRRAASASARETGRTAYTKDVSPTKGRSARGLLISARDVFATVRRAGTADRPPQRSKSANALGTVVHASGRRTLHVCLVNSRASPEMLRWDADKVVRARLRRRWISCTVIMYSTGREV